MSDPLQLSPPSSPGLAVYPRGATFGPRMMRDFEFVWMVEGDAQYRWGDLIEPAPQGSVVLCRPGARDFFQWDKHRRTRHAYFHFQIQKSPASWGPPGSWPLVRPVVDGDLLRPLFRHLLTWHGKGDANLERLTMRHMLTAFVTGQHTCNDVPHDLLPPAALLRPSAVHPANCARNFRPAALRHCPSCSGGIFPPRFGRGHINCRHLSPNPRHSSLAAGWYFTRANAIVAPRGDPALSPFARYIAHDCNSFKARQNFLAP